MSGEFVDTNVLVYAHDQSAGRKREISVELLLRLLNERSGCLSVQVLMEFYVTVTLKIPKPLPGESAAEIIKELLTWNVYSPPAVDVLDAIRISRENQIGFWDAMIIRAAAAKEASIIWTEDLNPGQIYEGIEIRNPYLQDG